jgi:hypothetical protein
MSLTDDQVEAESRLVGGWGHRADSGDGKLIWWRNSATEPKCSKPWGCRISRCAGVSNLSTSGTGESLGKEDSDPMSTPERRGGIGGISLGGILVIVGIVVMLVWSILLGLIIVLIGLVAFGGFAKGRWY